VELAHLSATTVALLVAAAFAAGWVDAVVGGGGLIQLPALLLALPAATAPAAILATNKLASICGTTTSSITYYRRVHPDLRTSLPMAGWALAGAAAGAAGAGLMPPSVFRPLVLVLLVLVALWTLLRPDLGSVTRLRFSGRHHHAVAAGIGVCLGFYDGIFGPGTGSFLVIALVGVLGYAFLDASAHAKIVNLATNLGALVVFVAQGAPLWGLGLLMGSANVSGAYLGARTAVARGSRFVRLVFLAVVLALVVRLAWELLPGRGTTR